MDTAKKGAAKMGAAKKGTAFLQRSLFIITTIQKDNLKGD